MEEEDGRIDSMEHVELEDAEEGDEEYEQVEKR